MQPFWKLKVLEHILLKSCANGNLNLIEVQFLAMKIHFGFAVRTSAQIFESHFKTILKFVSLP